MALNFKKYSQTGEVFLKKLATQLGDPSDTAKAGRVLRAVLRVFRDQSPPEESVQLISQLPMYIKAVYVDGWQLGKKPKRSRHLNDFLFEVKLADGSSGDYDFEDDEAISNSVKAVFNVIKQYASPGEMEDVIKTLPEELRPLLEEA